MNKRGQFFLLAAVIIIVVVVGLVATRNYVVAKDEPKRFFDLSDEIKFEGGQVIDYGISEESISKGDYNNLIEDFLASVEWDLYDYNPDNEFIFVFGNSEGAKVLNLAKGSLSIRGEEQELFGGNLQVTSSVSDRTFGAGLSVDGSYRDYKDDWKRSVTGEKIKVVFDDKEYDFELNDNQKFYLIIKREVDENKYVAKK